MSKNKTKDNIEDPFRNKKVGINFLHPHYDMEKELSVPDGHIIVDREDWVGVVEYILKQKKH